MNDLQKDAVWYIRASKSSSVLGSVFYTSLCVTSKVKQSHEVKSGLFGCYSSGPHHTIQDPENVGLTMHAY